MTQSVFSLEAQKKSLSGAKSKSAVREILKILQNEKLILNWTEVVKAIPRTGFEYEEAHKPHFLVETLDLKIIVLFVSSSYRTDRAKISFYDMEGILNHSEFSGKIKSSIYLIEKDDQNSFVPFRERVSKRQQYCPFDNLLFVDELVSFFIEYEKAVRSHKLEIEESISTLNRLTSENLTFDDYCLKIKEDDPGKYGKIGHLYEKYLVDILNNPEFLNALKDGNQYCPEEYSKILFFCCNQKNIDLKQILYVSANNSVPLLRNGGNPKTDLIVRVRTSLEEFKLKFSIKNTTQGQVSCQERNAEDFIKVLGLNDHDRLASYLRAFQKYGSWQDLLASNASFSVNDFHLCYSPHRERLAEWALMGLWEKSENLISEDQISEFIFVRKIEKDGIKESLYCKSLKAHIDDLLDLTLGSTWDAFAWTYPSGNRGKKIVLKLILRFLQR